VTVRVLLADDQRLVRESLGTMLGLLDGIELVDSAADGEQALALAAKHRPDVVLMDLRMPRLDGIEATRALRDQMPDVAVIALTTYADDESVLGALRAGARGYVLKGAQQDEIIRAIEAVAAGEAIFGPGIARRVLGLVSAPPAPGVPFQGLTSREREILNHVAAGARNAEIARRMSIAPKTVANHISAIFTKLQIADRGEAIILARDAGLVTTRDPELGERMRRLRNHGSPQRYLHTEFGWNARMDAIQAAILRVKLPYIERWNQERRERAATYDQLLTQTGLWSATSDSPLRPLQISPQAHHVFHQYVVRAKRRDELRQFLSDRKIGTEIYYPIPLHLQPCFAYLGYREGDLPVSEQAAKEVLALPMFPELTESEQKWVVECIAEFYS